MMRTLAAAILVAAAAATAHAQAKPAPKAGKNAFGKSYYVLSLPTGYAPARKYGLVVMLHGSGGRPENYAGMYAMAPGKGCFVLLPASNDPKGYDEQGDMPQIIAMVEEVMAAFSIDRDRVLVSGHSAGGFTSGYLVRKRPDLFTAAAPVSGTIAVSGDDVKHVPFYVVSGKKDFNNKQATQAVEQMRAAGMDVKFDDPPDWDHNSVGDAWQRIFTWFDGLIPADAQASLQASRAQLEKKAWGKAATAARKVADAKNAAAQSKRRAARVLAEVDAAAERELAAAREADGAGDTKKAIDLLSKSRPSFEGAAAAAAKIDEALKAYRAK